MNHDALTARTPARSIGDLLRGPTRLFGRDADLGALLDFAADPEGPVLHRAETPLPQGQTALYAVALQRFGFEPLPGRSSGGDDALQYRG